MRFGWRIIKTGLAVALCVWLAQLFQFKYPFYSAIAAVIAMQATIADSFKQGALRMQGTIVGAITGYLFALVAIHNPWWTGLGLIVTLALLKALGWIEAMNIASIVFIAITVNLTGQPLNYSFNRIVDTLLGISVAFVVNRFLFPPRYQQAVQESFQQARGQVIELYQCAFRSLLDSTISVSNNSFASLKNSLDTAGALVKLKQKESIWGKADENFRQQYFGPLSRLEQMAFAINEIIKIRQTWQFPLSYQLEIDLVDLLNSSHFVLSLITQPVNEVAPSAYAKTNAVLERVKEQIKDDMLGDYAGTNRLELLQLTNWIEHMLSATTGCLNLGQPQITA